MCENGDAAACVALAQAAEKTKDVERAASLYVKAGVLYNRGSGVTRDIAQAALYYDRGCELGDMSGCNNLGTVYEFGSIGRDPTKAADLYDRACRSAHMGGCANLGLLLLGTPGADKARARELLEKACAAGITRACSKVR